MAFNKKTWKDRLVEFAGRRSLKRVSGNADSTIVVDVSRNEGTVSQAGDAFSAANMNDLEQRIADEFGLQEANTSTAFSNISSLSNRMGGCSLQQSGSDFYIVGSNAVKKKLGSIFPLITVHSAGYGVNLLLDVSNFSRVEINSRNGGLVFYRKDDRVVNVGTSTGRIESGIIDISSYTTLGLQFSGTGSTTEFVYTFQLS